MGVEAEEQDLTSQAEEETRDSKSPDKEQILSEEADKQESANSEEAECDGKQDSLVEEKEDEVVEEPEKSEQKTPKLKLWNRLFKRGKKLKIQEADGQDAEAGTELLVHNKTDDIQNSTNNKDHEEIKRSGSGTDVTVAVTDDQEGDGEPGRKITDQARLMKKQLLFGGIFLLFVVVAITLASVLGNSGSGPKVERAPALAHIDCGPVQGVMEDDVYVFRGIPYALPPTGDRRWKRAEMVSKLPDCWSDTYNAVKSSKYCYQAPIEGHDLEYSEDCLYLDVITPEIMPKQQRPVVVYLPGDSLLGRTKSDIAWGPYPALSKEKDVIFVTFNYRTSALGFLSLDILKSKERSPKSGNYGLYDQLAALKWVHRNIQQFGGDPEKITLFAHGSGATAALALVSSRNSHGLFTRAWLTGLSANFPNRTLDEINENNAVFLRNINCTTLDCLANKTGEEIVASTPDFWNKAVLTDLPDDNEEAPLADLLVPDGMLIYDSFENMWKRGDFNNVPTVFGSTAQELASEIKLVDMSTWNWTDFSEYITKRLDGFDTNLTEEILNVYINHDSDPQTQFASMVSDIRVTCPIHYLSDLASEYTESGVFTYVVDYIPSSPLKWTDDTDGLQMAVHGIDVVAIFGLLKNYISLSENDVMYQNLIQDIFYNFVRNGEPYADGSPLKSTGFVNTIGKFMKSHEEPYSNCLVWMSKGWDREFGRTN